MKLRKRCGSSRSRYSLVSLIRDFDDYGAPISLRHQGRESFRTVPGALLSILCKTVILIYLMLRGQSLIYSLDWQLSTQTTSQTRQDLEEDISFDQRGNISLAVQLDLSYGGLNVTKEGYELQSKILHRYGEVVQINYIEKGNQLEFVDGKVEYIERRTPNGEVIFKRDGKFHTIDQGESLHLNKFGLYEFQLDLSKVKLKGSSSSFEATPTQYATFAIKANYEHLIEDAFTECKEEPECDITLMTDARLRNYMF